MDLAEAEVGAIRDLALVDSRREQILDAALQLFLEKGYASTTIRDICERSGVNQASIYDYVANKQDILRRLLNRFWFRSSGPTLPERLADPAERPLEEILEGFLREGWTSRRKGALLAYRSVPHLEAEDRRVLRERDERLIEALAAFLRRRAGLAEDDPRAKVAANFLIFANAFGPMRDWLHRDVEDEAALRTVVRGLVAFADTLSEDAADD
jgi:AcrR family transcriptional regulator